MKYQVLYRLMRTGYVPSMSMQLVEARNHRELDEALASIRQKWEIRGYQVSILAVNKRVEAREQRGQ